MAVSSWKIEGTEIGQTVDEVRSWDLLELTLRYGESDISNINSILEKSSKGTVLLDAAGGFQAVDTGDANDISITAPSSRSDLRTVDTWFLEEYSRELIKRDGSVYEIDLELIPIESKEYDNQFGSFDSEPTVSSVSDEWTFDFQFGNFNTNSVTVAAEETPDGTRNTYTITMLLSQKKTRIVEENASHLNTVKLREVPDGIDVIDDTSEDSRQTVNIQPPGTQTEPLSPSDYIIREWETAWNGGVFSIELEVTEV